MVNPHPARRLAGILAISAALALLAACCKTEYVRVPVPVHIDRIVVQPVDDRLLRQHPGADLMPPEQLHTCPDIARQRAAELAACNADKARIAALGHGQPAGDDGQGDRQDEGPGVGHD